MLETVQTVTLAWGDDEKTQGLWLSERRVKPPKGVVVVNDALNAQVALRAVLEGQAILWQGDYHQAKQLLDAIGRRLDANAARKKSRPDVPLAQRFHLHRQAQAQRARVLNSLLVPVGSDFRIQLRRAPDVSEALIQAWGEPTLCEPVWVSLREILGMIGAFEWRKKGVEVPTLGARIFPFYGVFSPIRGEYVQLVAQAKLPTACLSAQGLAVEVGAGTGVLSALLAKRGVSQVIATELDARAVACAQFNIHQLGLGAQVEVQTASMFGDVQADLVVCNPPWLPAKPSSAIESALYDENHHMLKTFLHGLPSHLRANGEGWLIMSDLAEHLGLRLPGQLEQWIRESGLEVVERLQVRPQHQKVFDVQDPLHVARQQEVTSLWRLRCVGV